MVLAPLYDLAYPVNTIFFFQSIVQITRFNILPADKIIGSWMTFNDNESALNLNFEEMDIF